MANFDLADDLHIAKNTIGQHQINKILTKLRKMTEKIEDFAVKRWVVYSPLIDQHNTEIIAGIADEDIDESTDSSGMNLYTRYPPYLALVVSYDLTHSISGTVTATAFDDVTKFGGGCKYDGLFNHIIADYSTLNPTDKIAIGGWIRPKAFTGAEQIIIIKDSQYKMVINAASNTIEASVYISGSWGTAVTYIYTPDVFIDIWMDWDGTTLELWVNGAMVDSEARAGALNTTANNVGIGGTAAGGSRLTSGTILSWWSAIHESVANVSNWLSDHYAGILRTKDADEIFTMPLYSSKPFPDASDGMFYG